MFWTLKNAFDLYADHIALPKRLGNIVIRQLHSSGQELLPGASHYICKTHSIEFPAETISELSWVPTIGLSFPDAAFAPNHSFRYPICKPIGIDRTKACIILLHGLNERSWGKYLPWAVRLSESTAQGVIMMPIAFHVNRAPAHWSLIKQMTAVSEQRQRSFPSIAGSSFANAAISTRLQSMPQRFFWSGFQTYQDIVQVVQTIRSGPNPDVAEDANINFFAYSIGGFLAEILLMANENNFFSASKLVLFCGGATVDRMCPVSKHILDSEAFASLSSFIFQYLERECIEYPRLSHYLGDGHSFGIYFKTMLSSTRMKDLREKRFRESADHIIAIALQRDEVMRPKEITNTLQGDDRDIAIRTHVLQFSCPYSHVSPFPVGGGIGAEVDALFDRVFDLAADHFNRE